MLPGARLCAARAIPAGGRRPVRLHAAGVRRSRRVSRRVGLLDLGLVRERRAGGRLCRLPRSVLPLGRAQPGRRGARWPSGRSGSSRRSTSAGRSAAGRVQLVTTVLKILPLARHRHRRHAGVRALALRDRRRRAARDRAGRDGDRDADAVGVPRSRVRDDPGREHPSTPDRTIPRATIIGTLLAAGALHRSAPSASWAWSIRRRWRSRRRHLPTRRASLAGDRAAAARRHRRRDFVLRRAERLDPGRRAAPAGRRRGRAVPARVRTALSAAARPRSA